MEKNFVQLKNGPFDIDLIFAPDGIENFEDAAKRSITVEGFPVCHIDDIIASKKPLVGRRIANHFRDYVPFAITGFATANADIRGFAILLPLCNTPSLFGLAD